MPISRDIDKWFDLSVEFDSRTIYMGSAQYLSSDSESGVDYLMAERFIKGIHSLELKNTKPILIMMNNPGGDWFHGMAIYDAIKTCKCHCTIRVYGHAMSMGSVILQAADERIMMPNSRMMVHYGYVYQDNHTKIVEKWTEESKRLNYMMENFFVTAMQNHVKKVGIGIVSDAINAVQKEKSQFEYPKPSTKRILLSDDPTKMETQIRAFVRSILDYDTILTPEEAISLGFADSIYGA
jgi:ATP-dependent protease ClpP protease subunit